MFLATKEQMRELDRVTIEELAVPGELLMESAGAAVARYAVDVMHSSGIRDPRILIVCGAGNNGGDGFVAARHLVDHVVALDVFMLSAPTSLKGDALANYERLSAFPARVHDGSSPTSLERLELLAGGADLIIDAIFGTGLDRPVEGHPRAAIEAIARAGQPVLAVDMPSGLDANTGRIHGVALRADHTVTFAVAKQGQLLFPGRSLVGRLRVEGIGIPVGLAPRVGLQSEVLSDGAFLRLLGPRPDDAYKQSFGHVFIAAGSRGKAGAALLAGRGAARTGAGLVTILSDPETATSLAGRYPDLMVSGAIGGAPSETFDPEAVISDALERADVWVIGCGFGIGDERRALLRRVLEAARVPVVLDADALAMVAEEPSLLDYVEGRPLILTPHPGELRRFAAFKGGLDAEADPVESLRRFATSHRLTLVAKGATTLIAASDGRVFFNVSGSPAMATAGSGDVLAGVTGALAAADRARVLDPAEIAAGAVALHARAGESLEARFGLRAATASDYDEALTEVLGRAERVLADRGHGASAEPGESPGVQADRPRRRS